MREREGKGFVCERVRACVRVGTRLLTHVCVHWEGRDRSQRRRIGDVQKRQEQKENFLALDKSITPHPGT